MNAVKQHIMFDLVPAAQDAPGKLFVADPSGSFVPAKDSQIIEAATAAVGRALRRGICFDSPEAARKYLPAMLGAREAEVFCVAHLDSRHRLIAFEEMFFGTIDGASVHPREVVKSALRHNSAALVLVHNHPSGNEDPSQADQLITARLREALGLVDIRVLDHFIVAGDKVTSFAERGLL
jgi:DNA repair protein RadC